MSINAAFPSGAGLPAIARSLSHTCGPQVCSEVLKVIAAFCGLVLVALFLATAVLSTSTEFF
jgi:hypothetical protein